MTAEPQPALVDAILYQIYRQRAGRILTHYDIASPSAAKSMAGYWGVDRGLCCGVSSGFTHPDPSTAVVVGGACLNNSHASADGIRVDYMADTILVLALAAWMRCRCLVYLPIGEELAVADSKSHLAWRRLGDIVERLVGDMADRLGLGQLVTIVRTDFPQTSAALDRFAGRFAGELETQELAHLYHVRPSSSRDRPAGGRRMSQYRRTITTYLPQTIRALLGDPQINHVIVGENFHQVRAVAAARRVCEGTSPGDRIDYVPHVPTPSVTATDRMSCTDEGLAIRMLEAPDSVAEKINCMAPAAAGFWRALAHVFNVLSPGETPDPLSLLMYGRWRLLAASGQARSGAPEMREP